MNLNWGQWGLSPIDNHLIAYRNSANNLVMSAGYNGDGLRAWKEDNGNRTYYLYDGTKIVAELDANGRVTSVMTWGATGLIARDNIWYQFDIQGNVLHRIDSDGRVKSTDMYDAWGNKLLGRVPYDPIGYQAQLGGYTDNETGLLLMMHRYYDPLGGRFITRDPIGYNGGLNVYRYVSNDPVNEKDPTGYDQWVEVPGPDSIEYYEHAFLQFAHPCRINGKQVSTIGFYADDASSIPRLITIGSPGHFNYPDPLAHAKDKHGKPIKPRIHACNNDPIFEDSLCSCVQDSLSKNPKPRYFLPANDCGSWAKRMWQCATLETDALNVLTKLPIVLPFIPPGGPIPLISR